MAEVIVGTLQDPASVAAFSARFAALLPDRFFGSGKLCRADDYLADGASRFVFLLDCCAVIFLPEGFRTREGDGSPLPADYKPDPLSTELLQAIELLREHHARESRARRDVLTAILSRWNGEAFTGDIANELWQMDQYGLYPKASPNREAVLWLRQCYREIGYSTKQTSGWEPLSAGDLLVVRPRQVPAIQGEILAWWVDDSTGANLSYLPAVRRARYLKDTAGGCNFAFDAFRRLPLTWYLPIEGEPLPDGPNRLNSHIVNMPEETSRTHYHPDPAVGGGLAQHELYLVLDHDKLGLDAYGRPSQLHVYPDAPDYARWQTIDLEAGMMCLIPPPVAHRGSNALVNVVTFPGFKPHNELYVDAEVARVAPHAPVHLGSASRG